MLATSKILGKEKEANLTLKCLWSLSMVESLQFSAF